MAAWGAMMCDEAHRGGDPRPHWRRCVLIAENDDASDPEAKNVRREAGGAATALVRWLWEPALRACVTALSS